MDIMMRLKGTEFLTIANAFREREKRLGHGLPLVEFVEIVLSGLPHFDTLDEKIATVSALIDLFEEIDINGDSVMEFKEFTSFCVEAGMTAPRTQGTTLKHRYQRDPKSTFKTTAGSIVPTLSSISRAVNLPSTKISNLKWSADFRMFLVIENSAQSVKFFTGEGKFVTDVSVRSSGSKVTTSDSSIKIDKSILNGVFGKDKKSVLMPPSATPLETLSLSILDAVFIYRFLWLAVSTTDSVISFYKLNESRRQLSPRNTPRSKNFELLQNLGILATTPQKMLRFCESSALLLGSGNDFIVNVWKIVDIETKILLRRLSGHFDLVMDALEVPLHDLLVTCDLQHSIQLWNLSDGRNRGSLVAHERGIRQLCYSKQHDLLLSAGFEYDVLAWDLASRQVAVKLSGHRAPLISIQLALFQTERAITADCQGVFKVWDISRGNTKSTDTSIFQAIQLESFRLGVSSVAMKPVAFVSMYPYSRDLWVATSDSCTLHRLRSVRVQQLDEVPLRAFYHSTANKFVVVAGSVCSLWDGESGSCSSEFTHVGIFESDKSVADEQYRKRLSKSNSVASLVEPSIPTASPIHSGHNEADPELVICANDVKCRKLVVMSEQGVLSVFDCQNFVQLRKCQESFLLPPSVSHKVLDVGQIPVATSARSCAVKGLHYCSENKLIIVADAGSSAIIVIDDDSNQALSNGMVILRRLSNIPDGITASAYSFHASMVATVGTKSEAMKIALWDFETLAFMGNCQFDDEQDHSMVASNSESILCIQQLEFWNKFPVLLASDSLGGVYFFAVTPLTHAYTGKLLHAFLNVNKVEKAQLNEVFDSNVNINDQTFEANNGMKQKEARCSQNTTEPVTETKFISLDLSASVVTCMKMVYDEEKDRYLLFMGDERGYVGVWDPISMIHRLALKEISKKNCKYLRRGYQPKAMFQRNCLKNTPGMGGNEFKQSEEFRQSFRQGSASSKSRLSLLGSDAVMRRNVRASNMKTQPLSRQHNRGLLSHKTQQANASLKSHLDKIVVTNSDAAAKFLICKDKVSSFQKDHTSGVDKQLNTFKSTKSWPGSSCYENYPRDIMLLCRWQAHIDAVSSLEISHHPNIAVTCGLDMRVFVWSWDGACLGKLFDPDNQGPWPWRFQKDNATRTKKRELFVANLIQQIERTPAEKIKVRRQTLFAEHVDRWSLHESSKANSMLLEHVISKTSEIKLLELETQSGNKDLHNHSKSQEAFNTQLAPVTTTASITTPRQTLRLHTLDQLSHRSQSQTRLEIDQVAFLGVEDLKMDKHYLETELLITCPTASSPMRRPIKDAGVQQTEMDNKLAREAVATRAKLAQRAREMYSNMEDVRASHRKHRLDSVSHDLEVSDFLKQHFPPSVLAARPQTAPIRSLKTSASAGHVGIYQQRENKQLQLQISASENNLPTTEGAFFVNTLGSSKSTLNKSRRRSSLDEVYTEEAHRYRQDRSLSREKLGITKSNSEKQQVRPLYKLREINDIIAKVHEYCDEATQSVRPRTAPAVSRGE
ncbi:putative quinoprotein alcohol dehydrogenase-like superfamily [Plasmopara halstedii]